MFRKEGESTREEVKKRLISRWNGRGKGVGKKESKSMKVKAKVSQSLKS